MPSHTKRELIFSNKALTEEEILSLLDDEEFRGDTSPLPMLEDHIGCDGIPFTDESFGLLFESPNHILGLGLKLKCDTHILPEYVTFHAQYATTPLNPWTRMCLDCYPTIKEFDLPNRKFQETYIHVDTERYLNLIEYWCDDKNLFSPNEFKCFNCFKFLFTGKLGLHNLNAETMHDFELGYINEVLENFDINN